MIKQLIKTCPELFVKFPINEWNSCKDANELTAMFQTIADSLSKLYYGENTPSFCTIEICKLNSPTKKGEFDPNTNRLLLEYELFVNKLKIPYYSQSGAPIEHYVSNKECLDVFLHEYRHAMQHYERTHETNKHFISDAALLNFEHNQNKNLNAYFRMTQSRVSDILYHLQPAERDAFIYAQSTLNDLVNEMAKLYSEDLTFKNYSSTSQFDINVKISCDVFNTQTPFEDIDDIIRHINGIEPSKPLNEEMWQAVQDSQKKEPKGRFLGRFFDEESNYINEEELGVSEEEYGDREL